MVLVKVVMHQIDFVYQDMLEDEKLKGAKLTLIARLNESRIRERAAMVRFELSGGDRVNLTLSGSP
jgi:hypothetical protein